MCAAVLFTVTVTPSAEPTNRLPSRILETSVTFIAKKQQHGASDPESRALGEKDERPSQSSSARPPPRPRTLYTGPPAAVRAAATAEGVRKNRHVVMPRSPRRPRARGAAHAATLAGPRFLGA